MKRTKGKGAVLPTTRIKVDYLKNGHFRVVHADGIYGGSTPQGYVQMVFFNERHPIPVQMEYEVTPQGQLGPEIPESRITRGALVREVDVAVTMKLDTAKAVHKWLGACIEKMEPQPK